MKTLVLHFTCLCLILSTWSSSTLNSEEIQVLFLGDRGHHQPAKRFEELEPVLRTRGIHLTYSGEVSSLNAKTLARYQALVVYANIDEISAEQAQALLNYVNEGGGFVPLHCASYCFRNNEEVVALIGAQFKRHGTGVFRSERARASHPIMKGYGGFESWDETYVHHLHNEKNRTVLEYRVDREGREPWTWIRTHGKGRVFYTAWGHDTRTWTHPGFQNLVERGIRWVVKQDPGVAGEYLADVPFPLPKIKPIPQGLKKFEYVDVGKQIPNYRPSRQWGTQGEPLNQMQKPVPAEESIKHMAVPEGFHVELFASEPDIGGKPLCMAWDEKGRLWVAESYDYPNELRTENGRDRIRICEDTDRDGKADKFTVFADQLSIPTSITFSRGGVIVQNGVETLYLKDTNGDDRADVRTKLITNWALGDTHGGVSNFQYGLDNWIWGMQGYNNSAPVINGVRQQAFRMGFFRFRPDGSEIEFIRSTNNNTWGLGFSEEGLVFGSTANGCPSVFMPIENRYYERVKGWTPSLTLGSIADSNNFSPVTSKVRQVDHHGGYTAAAGHALYTAREYPQEYWNRVAFVNGPTGHLVGGFVLKPDGSGFKSTSPFNLLASDDEWTAPIMSEVGPDGQVWVVDWYNYIIQHNPTPKGFSTGKGQAYVSKLRDKKHGRIYRVVADSSKSAASWPDLSKASPAELVAALKHPTLLIRKHAQRLLVESGDHSLEKLLLPLIKDQSVDEIGLNVGAIHAIWTLDGLGLTEGIHEPVNQALFEALSHPSAGVRRNALKVLPATSQSTKAVIESNLLTDRNPQVRLSAILALSDLPPSRQAAAELAKLATNPSELADRWIPDAITSAAAQNSREFLAALGQRQTLPPRTLQMAAILANHLSRSREASKAPELLAKLRDSNPLLIETVLTGLMSGGSQDSAVTLSAENEAELEQLMPKLSAGARGKLVKLATNWGSNKFKKYQRSIADGLLEQVRNEGLSDKERIKAAQQLVDFMNDDDSVVTDLLDSVTPQASPELGQGLLESLGRSQAANLAPEFVDQAARLTPSLKSVVIAQLLKRPGSVKALLTGIEKNKLSLGDLALDQKQVLATYPDREIRSRATEVLRKGGALPNADRQKVYDQLVYLTKQQGDVEQGKLVFKEHCAKCHQHGSMGSEVGPNLTGMAVHSKEELLLHIVDPSRNVEGNYRIYKVATIDGLNLSGMLASESRTAIELVDTEGKRKSVLREDIEQFSMSNKSVMPEGFEKSIPAVAMKNLLEFLTDKGRFIPVELDKYATAVSTKALFSNEKNGADQMIFPDWKPKVFNGVPFTLTDPRGQSKPNIILLHGPFGPLPPKMPKSVAIPCNTSVQAVHVLGGVGGWNFPYDRSQTVSLIVEFKYVDGKSEQHKLLNGVHIADYIRRVDVPKSQFAFKLRDQQIRYLQVKPNRAEKIREIRFVKGTDNSSPIIMGVTIESLESDDRHNENAK